MEYDNTIMDAKQGHTINLTKQEIEALLCSSEGLDNQTDKNSAKRKLRIALKEIKGK